MQLYCFQTDFNHSFRDNENLVIKTIEFKMLEAKNLASFITHYNKFDLKHYIISNSLYEIITVIAISRISLCLISNIIR